MNIAIIFAAGKGERMGSVIPKQFLKINEKPILIHTIEIFEYHKMIDKIYVVVQKEYIQYVKNLKKKYNLDKIVKIVEGGNQAQESIYNGIKEAEKENPEDSIVLLHDGVRPFISEKLITDNINAVMKYGSAITSIPSYETILISQDENKVTNVPYRRETFIGQAPQSFYLKDIVNAHENIRKRPEGYENMVDACTIFNTLGIETHMVNGNRGNLKITTPEDVYVFKAYLKYKENEQTFGLN